MIFNNFEFGNENNLMVSLNLNSLDFLGLPPIPVGARMAITVRGLVGPICSMVLLVDLNVFACASHIGLVVEIREEYEEGDHVDIAGVLHPHGKVTTDPDGVDAPM